MCFDFQISLRISTLKDAPFSMTNIIKKLLALLAAKKSTVSSNRDSCKLSSIPTSLNVAKAIVLRGGATVDFATTGILSS